MTEAKTTKKTAKLKAATPAKAPKATKKVAGKSVTVQQNGSPARSASWVYGTLEGLGLGKLNRIKTLEDTPAVRGMINRVHHLVKVIDAA